MVPQDLPCTTTEAGPVSPTRICAEPDSDGDFLAAYVDPDDPHCIMIRSTFRPDHYLSIGLGFAELTVKVRDCEARRKYDVWPRYSIVLAPSDV